MTFPIEITWHRVDKSDAVEAAIHRRAEKLGEFYDGIIDCRVVVEPTTRRHHKGNRYRIGIEVKVPETTIMASHDPVEHQAHEDILVAVRDAFHAARRQLQDYARIRRGAVRAPPVRHTATVLRKLSHDGYGFLLTPDGREIYFDRYALTHGDFDDLDEGTEVSYVEEQGHEGPQARQVSTGRHGPAPP